MQIGAVILIAIGVGLIAGALLGEYLFRLEEKQ